MVPAGQPDKKKSKMSLEKQQLSRSLELYGDPLRTLQPSTIEWLAMKETVARFGGN